MKSNKVCYARNKKKRAGLYPLFVWPAIRLYGTHGRIRTSDLPLRRRTLYPAELRGHIYNIPILLKFISYVNWIKGNLQKIYPKYGGARRKISRG